MSVPTLRIAVRLLYVDDPDVVRVLDVPAEMDLGRLHLVLQLALGWTDSHLHSYSRTNPYEDGPWADRTRWVDLPGFEEHGLDIFEEDLDENLISIGELLRHGPLFYEYDMGDSWMHRIDLVADDPNPLSADEWARLVDGSGRCPLEDVSGPPGWHEFKKDKRGYYSPNYYQWLESVPVARCDIKPGTFNFDRARRQLSLLGRKDLNSYGVGTLAHTVLEDVGTIALITLYSHGGLDGPSPDLSADQRRAFLEPFRWLIRRVDNGVPLTSSGWLPPAVVREAVDELGWADGLYGKGNREEHVRQLADLRSEMTRMGLLRKSRGVLTATEMARRVTADDNALWSLIVARLATRWRDEAERLAGGAFLWMMTAGQALEHDQIDALVLLSLLTRGYMRDTYGSLLKSDTWELTRRLWQLLRAVGGLVELGRLFDFKEQPTPALQAFARDVLLYRG